jgi:hypothetical protein
MTKITASTRVVQPAGIRSQPPRAAKRGHGRREATLLCNSILLRSPVASTLPENPVDGRPADLERLRCRWAACLAPSLSHWPQLKTANPKREVEACLALYR